MIFYLALPGPSIPDVHILDADAALVVVVVSGNTHPGAQLGVALLLGHIALESDSQLDDDE